jgi:RNA polymerase sigma factor (sigma-70 family)
MDIIKSLLEGLLVAALFALTTSFSVASPTADPVAWELLDLYRCEDVPAAFTFIYCAYNPWLTQRIEKRHNQDNATAQDVAQEVWARLSKIRKRPTRDSFKGFLAKIARNEVARLHKLGRNAIFDGAIYYEPAIDDIREPDLGPEVVLSHEHDADRIKTFVSHLQSIDHRNVAYLALCREANPTEISRQTGISRAQVNRYLAEIRIQFKSPA